MRIPPSLADAERIVPTEPEALFTRTVEPGGHSQCRSTHN